MEEAIAQLQRESRNWRTVAETLDKRNEKLEREFKEFKDLLLNEMKLPKMIRQYETLQWLAHHVKEEIYAESDPFLQKLLKELGEDEDEEEKDKDNPSRR